MGAQKRRKKGPNYDPQAYDNEFPVLEVQLGGFRIGKYPVTVQEYGTFIKSGGYAAPKHWAGGFGQFREPDNWKAQQQYPNRPVAGVNWYESSAYCSWKGGPLPTEAEWERAAGGPKNWRYPWGNEPPLDPSRANYYHEKGAGRVTPVGLFPRGNTAEGLCDMLGNV
jgi:iron(II)-dependent oxidoreductase